MTSGNEVIGSLTCLLIMGNPKGYRWIWYLSSEYHRSHNNDQDNNDKSDKRVIQSQSIVPPLGSHSHPTNLPIILKHRSSIRLRMAHHWRKKPKNLPVGRHDKEASSSRGLVDSQELRKKPEQSKSASGSSILRMKFGQSRP
jgi:hypothetical protein